jgi:hypothetical protein
MIDLHLHTYYSDGTLSPEELVTLAQKSGTNAIAITDHDGMGGLSEGARAGKRRGVRVIPGIELSAVDDEGAYMHILGYCFDRENEELKNEVEWIRQKRVERNGKMLAALRGIGCGLSAEDLQLREGQDYIGKPTFALALLRKGYVSSTAEAFREGRFLRSDAVRSVHREKVQAKRAIELIGGAGGVPVLAHPMKVFRLARRDEAGSNSDGYFESLDRLLSKLKSWGLSGMECYYSEHQPSETKRLVLLAKKHGLLITAGSDFHGTEFEGAAVGGFYTDENFDEAGILSELTKCHKIAIKY